MQISIQIPNEVALTLGEEQNELSRMALEAFAIEGYRQDRLSEHQVAQLLGLKSRLDVHAFLKDRRVPLNYSLAELEQDIKTLALLEEKMSA